MTNFGYRPNGPAYKLTCNHCRQEFESLFRRGLCDGCFERYVEKAAEEESKAGTCTDMQEILADIRRSTT